MTDRKLTRKLQIATLGAASTLLLAPLANAQSEETDQAQVTVESSEPEVSVKQAEPEVTVGDSATPNVNVANDQDEAEVIVEQPEPKVTVNMPEPDVEVIQADSAEGGEASQPPQTNDVQVEQEQPGAQVEQEQPRVTAGQDSPEPAEPEPAAPEPAAPEPSPLDRMQVSDLEGMTVHGTGGDELGSIDNVVMSNDNNNVGVVIGMGGFWGLFEEQVLIPLSELQLDGDQLVWQTTKTPDEMEQSGFDEQNYTEVSSQDYELVGDLRRNAQ
ncbi:hypothetical protein GCM10027040_28750 [Halomonas shantousis]